MIFCISLITYVLHISKKNIKIADIMCFSENNDRELSIYIFPINIHPNGRKFWNNENIVMGDRCYGDYVFSL